MTQILSTKKLSKALKKKFSDAGMKLVEKNFIQTKAVSFETPQLNDYLVFTSKQAVKSVLKSGVQNILLKPCLCVGSKTKNFLEKKGFTVIESADYAEDLIQIIDSKYKDNSFTFFCGNIRKNTIPDFFQQNKIAYNEIVVYETKLKPHQIKKPFDGILFFSPSGVNSFLEKNSLENKKCFCIGNTTAKALENKTENIVIASQPTVENVINEVIHYYKRL
ncbi:uroporphyrinogen-III synthase [Flavobacterium cheniae]|uniref:Uroporphyrinogen-III synthase n=1 Tax=Flavobacterium cheniae TaxID=295428 RepID=A0A562KH29_9FLAO|nr:uroporphyrinogen-III synthase [Flavobacterium cheniae]TDR24464.1 uroporphyrinogen-III synthase [Flavobacterium cheniae]TWH94719.1 uroporphyrinogen-III synthase [Flavobacterium cheniae]